MERNPQNQETNFDSTLKKTAIVYTAQAYANIYREKPVSVYEFISHPDFLGRLTDGGKKIFPVWQNKLAHVARNNRRYLIVLTGSIGIGKTTVAVIGLLYSVYRIMCLNNAYEYFNVPSVGKFVVAFFNLTKSLSHSKGFTIFQDFLMNSPWFLGHGGVIRGQKDKYMDLPMFEWALASPYARGFGCLTADVKVSLLDGRELTIPEIMQERSAGKEHWVYSYDCTKKMIVPGKVIFADRTKRGVKVVKVTLDNGMSVSCTPDHPFLLRNGQYVEAKDLKPNDSLMPLYRRFDKWGYEQFYDVERRQWFYTHRRMAGTMPSCFRDKLGRFVRGIVVHHIDFNRRNNCPPPQGVRWRAGHSAYMKRRWADNHKVVSVEEQAILQDVYDLTIEGFHNFALTAGVFVHNTVGGDIIGAIMDEVDSPTESEAQKIRVLDAYNSTVRRFESRFIKDDITLGRFFLVASKQDELSFLNTFIEEMKDSERVYIVDMPYWVAKKDAIKYSGRHFPVCVGDAYTPPRILKNDEEARQARAEGLKVIDVPVEHREDFERDVVGALKDIAGVSVKGQRKMKLFPSEKFIKDCIDPKKQDPVKLVTIPIGLKDEVDLIDYLDLTKIRASRTSPRAIACDISFAHDAMGLAMSTVVGWTQTQKETEDGTFVTQKAPIVETDFAIRLVAREGDRIPLHKVRKFILDLRQQGFNIAKYVGDLRLASEDTFQILERAGIKTEYFSMDKELKPYMDFRNMVYERRWVCHEHKYLMFELRHLEHDPDKGKIDHPDKVKDIEILEDGSVVDVVLTGSKDMADAVASSVLHAVTLAEAPMDIEGMKAIMKKVSGVSESEVDKGKYWWVVDERTGKPVVGANQDDMQKFKKLVRRMT